MPCKCFYFMLGHGCLLREDNLTVTTPCQDGNHPPPFLSKADLALCVDDAVPKDEVHVYPSRQARDLGEDPMVIKLKGGE